MSECGWLAYYCTSDKPRLEIRPSCFHWLRESVQSHWLHVTPRHPQSRHTCVTSPITRHRSSRSVALLSDKGRRWNPNCESPNGHHPLHTLTHRASEKPSRSPTSRRSSRRPRSPCLQSRPRQISLRKSSQNLLLSMCTMRHTTPLV